MRGMQLTRLYIILALIVTAIIASGCNNGGNKKELSASGTVEATETNVNAEVGGKLMDILVEEGSVVKKGDVLARIDSTIQALQVQQAEANLRAAQEKSKEIKAGSRTQLISQAQASVQQISSLQQGAQNSVNNALDNLKRTKALFEQGGATAQQLSDAQNRYETARAQLEAYSAQKKSAQEQVDLLKSGATTETINIADAGITQAQVSLSIAKAQLAKTVLYAPGSGVISSLNFQKGEVISSGAPIATISDTNDLWVKVFIPEQDLPKIKLGQKADAYIDAYPDQPFHGEVSYISPTAEFTPKNLQTKEERVNMVFAVKVKIADSKDRLKPGLPTDITIITQ
jgi:HlyD family secretion protein